MALNIHDEYLKKFNYGKNIHRDILVKELDQVWDTLNLNNKISIQLQAKNIAEFYSHPVWILNGLFSDNDPESKRHRIEIAKIINKLNLNNIADFGGGSGVLARCIAKDNEFINIDIIEPYPSEIFIEQVKQYKNIHYTATLNKEYDLIIAQDVLEHVEFPMDLAKQMIIHTKIDGHLFFANCFMPEIKCHIPSNFYLNHVFKFLVKFAGLKYIGNVENANHVQIYKKFKTTNFYIYDLVCLFLYKIKFIFTFYDLLKILIKKIVRP